MTNAKITVYTLRRQASRIGAHVLHFTFYVYYSHEFVVYLDSYFSVLPHYSIGSLHNVCMAACTRLVY